MAKNAKTGQNSPSPSISVKGTAKGKKSETKTPLSSSTGEVIFSLRAGTPIFVKTADICSAIGKTNQWVGQLTSQGVIHKSDTKHGSLYNLFETIKAYCAYLEERVKRVDEDTAELDVRRKRAEAEFKEAKATVAMLEADEFQGKMHRSEDVQAMTADLLFFVRGSITALAGRCATDCAASSDPAEIQKIIEREVYDILKDLSEYKYDPKRYDELVRQRMNRDTDSGLDDEED